MDGILRWLFLIFCFFLFCFTSSPADAAEPFKMTSSTQFLWGDDLLGNSDPILAQYLRFTYTPEGKNLTVTGYGRLWYDFGSGDIMDKGFQGKLYYLLADYTPIENLSFRLGRQMIAFTSLDQTILDGLRVDYHNLGPFGVTVAGGWYSVYSLDSQDFEQSNNTAWAIDLHLEKVKNLQLGVSFAQKYADGDLARQAIGMNMRYSYKFLSLYGDARFEWLTNSWDQATIGLDIFPADGLLIKGEYYRAYPTFDATSIYSVFAVDHYQQYLLHAEYTLDAPVSFYGEYAHELYEENSDADRWTLGTKFRPLKNLALDFSVDYRNGYGGNLWGFQVVGNYKVMDKLILDAGIQYNEYRRPDQDGNQFARRYWVAGNWLISKNLSFTARIEDNVNENFSNNTLGRIALNWNL